MGVGRRVGAGRVGRKLGGRAAGIGGCRREECEGVSMTGDKRRGGKRIFRKQIRHRRENYHCTPTSVTWAATPHRHAQMHTRITLGEANIACGWTQ